jgi:hypothetical protein
VDTEFIGMQVVFLEPKGRVVFLKAFFVIIALIFIATDSIPANCATLLNTEVNSFNTPFKVYPNPFENSFRIEGVEGNLEITIYNYLEQLVYQNATSNPTVQVDLKPGIYFLNIKQVDTNQSYITKLIRN